MNIRLLPIDRMLGVDAGNGPSELVIDGNHAMAVVVLAISFFPFHTGTDSPWILSNNLELEVTLIHPWDKALSTLFNLHK